MQGRIRELRSLLQEEDQQRCGGPRRRGLMASAIFALSLDPIAATSASSCRSELARE